MGRGSLYPYRYFMLIDEYHPEFHDEDNQWVQQFYEDFKENLCAMIDAVKCPSYRRSPVYLGREASLEFETDDVVYGIDASGGLPCLFAVPLALGDDYDDRTEEEIYESVHEEIVNAFNKFVKVYGDVFRYPTSAWTSEPYQEKYA
jgi:hypothetical protein